MSIVYKMCHQCGQELLKNTFVPNYKYVAKGSVKIYYRNICKECYNKNYCQKNLEYYYKNKEHLKEKMKERYRKNKEINDRLKKNLELHLEQIAPLGILQQIAQNL